MRPAIYNSKVLLHIVFHVESPWILADVSNKNGFNKVARLTTPCGGAEVHS